MSNNNVSSSSSSGIGFFGLLTITLIVLKLCGVISISWWWIILVFFAPLFIILGILLGILFFSVGLPITVELWDNRKRKKALKTRQARQRILDESRSFLDQDYIDVKSKRL